MRGVMRGTKEIIQNPNIPSRNIDNFGYNITVFTTGIGRIKFLPAPGGKSFYTQLYLGGCYEYIKYRFMIGLSAFLAAVPRPSRRQMNR